MPLSLTGPTASPAHKPEDSALGDARSSEPQDNSASPDDELLSQRTSVALYAPSCDGPGAASIFGKFMEFYQDLRCRYDQAHSTVLRLVP